MEDGIRHLFKPKVKYYSSNYKQNKIIDKNRVEIKWIIENYPKFPV